MGLIKEPNNINLTVLDKPWTSSELEELSSFIKRRKSQRKNRISKSPEKKRKKAS